MDISGWNFTDSIITHNYIFPIGTVLQPGSWIVLAEDTLKFHSENPGINVLGPAGFGFSNSNAALTVFNNSGAAVVWMHYHDQLPWPNAVDGYGRTLELLNDTLNPALPGSWFAGCIGGSPGGPYVNCSEEIIFSEINYKSATNADAGDWVEIYNKSLVPIDISGWKFRDDDDTHTFNIPNSTVLPGNGYLILYSDHTKFITRHPAINNIIGPFTFGLGSTGDAVRLFTANGRLYQSVVYDEAVPWPQGANGNGYTLEIIDMDGKFCEGTNWKDGCPEGSPGGPYIYPCLTTGIETIQWASELKVYPNPSNGKIYIEFGDKSQVLSDFNVQIINQLGEVILTKSFPPNNTLVGFDLSQFTEGLYFIKVILNDKIFNKKIVVEK